MKEGAPNSSCLAWCRYVAIVVMSGACTSTPDPAVQVEILGRGIIETTGVVMRPDDTSSVQARRADSKTMQVVQATEQIPLRPGVSYGIAFRVVRAPSSTIKLKAVLLTSAACRLKTTGELVHHNDSVLTVRVGEVRHLAARIPASEAENHCIGEPQPGIDTFRIFHGEDMLAEARFSVYRQVTR